MLRGLIICGLRISSSVSKSLLLSFQMVVSGGISDADPCFASKSRLFYRWLLLGFFLVLRLCLVFLMCDFVAQVIYLIRISAVFSSFPIAISYLNQETTCQIGLRF